MISDKSVNNLLSLKYKLQSLDWVHSVITILDVPLLNNSDKPLKDRLNNFVTLKDEEVDKNRGFKEILNSPVFRNFVISEDGKTTGIIVNIKKDEVLNDKECLICLEKFEYKKYKRVLKCCNNVYHKSCIDKWFKKNSTCPACRHDYLKEENSEHTENNNL